MDFIMGVPKRKNKNDPIFVVVETIIKRGKLNPRKVNLQRISHCQHLLKGDIHIAWDTQGNHLKLRHKVYQ